MSSFLISRSRTNIKLQFWFLLLSLKLAFSLNNETIKLSTIVFHWHVMYFGIYHMGFIGLILSNMLVLKFFQNFLWQIISLEWEGNAYIYVHSKINLTASHVSYQSSRWPSMVNFGLFSLYLSFYVVITLSAASLAILWSSVVRINIVNHKVKYFSIKQS